MDSKLNRILKESIPVLFLCILGELLAGVFLESGVEWLDAIPGALVLLPAILALRGNISSALGSRLGSAIHLGTIESEIGLKTFKNPIAKENIYASLILTLIMSTILGIFAYFVSTAIGLENVNLIHLVLIAVLAGFLSGIFLSFLTVYLAVFTASKGLDPDNVLTPSVATIGDIATMMFLFLSAWFVIAFI